MIHRRRFLGHSLGLTVLLAGGWRLLGQNAMAKEGTSMPEDTIEKLELSDTEWKQRLSPGQYAVLRREGTERAGSSPLNAEKREGLFACAGCALPLFSSATKYDSGTGWPSFFDVIAGHVQTKSDYKLVWPRTEYHCARCGGHQGHIFKDGPPPTGLRYCNNGVALTFIPKETIS